MAYYKLQMVKVQNIEHQQALPASGLEYTYTRQPATENRQSAGHLTKFLQALSRVLAKGEEPTNAKEDNVSRHIKETQM